MDFNSFISRLNGLSIEMTSEEIEKAMASLSSKRVEAADREKKTAADLSQVMRWSYKHSADVKVQNRNGDSIDTKVLGVSLLMPEDYMNLISVIPSVQSMWYLGELSTVDPKGNVLSKGSPAKFRPVIILESAERSGFPVGEVIKIADEKFVVLDEYRAIKTACIDFECLCRGRKRVFDSDNSNGPEEYILIGWYESLLRKTAGC